MCHLSLNKIIFLPISKIIFFTHFLSLFQVFSAKEEQCLVEYVIKCSKMFYGLSVKQTRRLAFEYAKTNLSVFPETWNTNNEAGLDWYYGFMRRNPQLSLRSPESTSIARATAFNPHSVQSFFKNYLNVMARENFQLDPSRIWNLDETGVKTVVSAPKVLSQRGLKQVGQISSAERGQLVTMCCCVNAIGNALPPVYVFPRVHFKDHMLNDGPAGSLGLANSTGWMVSDLFTVALKHFIRNMNVSTENPCVLLMDNHESHLSMETIELARNHGLVMLTFPPHCSHKMQPLDISVYGPFKKYYNNACNDWLLSHPGKCITIYEVAKLSTDAFLKAFTPSNITSGFKKAGIFPVNSEPFTDDDFLSCMPTDRLPLTDRPNESQLQANSSSISHHDTQRKTGSLTADKSLTDFQQGPLSPELVRPFPKALDLNRPSRKRRISSILTDPVTTESSDSVRQEGMPTVRHDAPTLDEPSTSGVSASSVIFENKVPGSGDFVLVKYRRKRPGGTIHYVGVVKSHDNQSHDYEIQFLRRSWRHPTCAFVEPNVPDISLVDPGAIIGVLPQPIAQGNRRLSGIFRFNCDLDSFNLH